jgi:transposase InsO family protein
VKERRPMKENGLVFRSSAFLRMCEGLGFSKKFNQSHRPQTDGKAECLIQSALRE